MFAVWMLFEKNNEKYFSKIISDFSKKYDAPSFKPHITIYGLIDLQLDYVKKIVSQSVSDMKQFYVKKTRVTFSDDFWKTIFVEFEENVFYSR